MDNAEQKKKTKLIKLLTGRPTLQAVKDKGYIKGTTCTYTRITVWTQFLVKFKDCFIVCFSLCRSGVWLQFEQSLSERKYHHPSLCLDVHWAGGEERYTSVHPMCSWLTTSKSYI